MSKHLRGVKPALRPDTDALTKAPPVPKHLSALAKAEWRRVLPQLIARQVITKADLAGVETYCMMTGTVRQIEQEQAATGGVIDLRMMGLAIRCAQTARQLAAEYGLSPTSRARLSVSKSDADDAPNPLLT